MHNAILTARYGIPSSSWTCIIKLDAITRIFNGVVPYFPRDVPWILAEINGWSRISPPPRDSITNVIVCYDIAIYVYIKGGSRCIVDHVDTIDGCIKGNTRESRAIDYIVLEGNGI